MQTVAECDVLRLWHSHMYYLRLKSGMEMPAVAFAGVYVKPHAAVPFAVGSPPPPMQPVAGYTF